MDELTTRQRNSTRSDNTWQKAPKARHKRRG